MTAGIDFVNQQDQVESTWREIQRLEREGAQGWQRRATNRLAQQVNNGSAHLTITYANGCEVEIARHYTTPAHFRDTVMRIVIPTAEARMTVPPSGANEENRRLLGVPPSRDNLSLAGQPVQVTSREQLENMFAPRASPERRSSGAGLTVRLPTPPVGTPVPVLKRYPNDIELVAIQQAMTALLSGRGTEVREDPGMPVWLCRHQWTSDGTEGGYRAGPEAFKILYRLQASILEADRALQEADQRAASTPFDGTRMRRRLLDT